MSMELKVFLVAIGAVAVIVLALWYLARLAKAEAEQERRSYQEIYSRVKRSDFEKRRERQMATARETFEESIQHAAEEAAQPKAPADPEDPRRNPMSPYWEPAPGRHVKRWHP